MTSKTIVLAVLLGLAGCKSSRSESPPIDARAGLERYWTHAVDGSIALDHELVPESDVTVPATGRVIPGVAIRRPPLTLVTLKQVPILSDIAGPQGWTILMQASGQGIRRGAVDDGGNRLAHRFHLGIEIVFSDTESLRIDYPHLDDATLAELPRTPEGLVRFAPLEAEIYLVFSEDNRAFRIVLDSLNVQESKESIARRGETASKPMPLVTMVTYQFPDYEEETVEMFTVVFEHRIVAEDRTFSGHQQVSPWLPLGPDAEHHPWNLRIQITEITSLSWLTRVSKDHGDVARPVADIFKLVK